MESRLEGEAGGCPCGNAPIQLTGGIRRMRPDGGAGLVTPNCGSILSLATEFIFNNEVWC